MSDCDDRREDPCIPVDVRLLIKEVLSDPELSPKEKNARVQYLMRHGSPMPVKVLAHDTPLPMSIPQEVTYHNEEEGQLGCKHYTRQAMIVAPCCNQVFGCRLCHDEAVSDHAIDRHAIEEMVCMHCHTVMPINESCTNNECSKKNESLAKYYCGTCKFFDDDPSKDIYHCDHCGLCRRGKGLDIDYKHCVSCNACISVRVFDTHKCIERSLESDCPLCHEFMFTSVEPVVFMNCGHAMHHDCFSRYVCTEYTCPICMKSIVDTSEHFAMFNNYVNRIQIPEELRGMRAKLLCNDCLEHSESAFHFYYHKCGKCESFNTRVVSRWFPDQPDVPVVGEDGGGGDDPDNSRPALTRRQSI